MKALWAVALLIGVAGVAAPQQKRTLTARSVRASLGEAMERVYSREISLVQENRPGTLDEVCRAALSWRVLDPDLPPPPKGKKPARLDNGPLAVTIDRLDSNDSEATAVVTKRYDDVFYRRPDKSSRVQSSATFRQKWINNGSAWLLMTTVPVKAFMKIDGKAFTPDKKFWNPNSSFRAGTPLDPTGRGESGPQ